MRVVVIGGAAIGAAVALALATDPAFRGSVVVLERDPTYARASTTLSAASIRTQFSTPENIRLSRLGWRFLAGAPARLGVDVGLRERGYLMLASGAGAAVLRANHAVQRAEGADVALLDPPAVAARFPWLATGDLALGALGLSGEGWFDAATLLGGLRATAIRAGATFLADEATGFSLARGRVRAVRARRAGAIAADAAVNAAGAWGGAVAALAGASLPVRAAKRTVFFFRCRDPRAAAIAAASPLIVDPSGAWVRPEGDGFIAGVPPPPDRDPPATDFEPDHALFEQALWPALAGRVPAFEAVRVERAWAGWYEMSDWDANGFVGEDPATPGLIHACGFSGHGVQHAPAVGQAVSDLIVHGAYRTVDLTALSPARLGAGRRVAERAVI